MNTNKEDTARRTKQCPATPDPEAVHSHKAGASPHAIGYLGPCSEEGREGKAVGDWAATHVEIDGGKSVFMCGQSEPAGPACWSPHKRTHDSIASPSSRMHPH